MFWELRKERISGFKDSGAPSITTVLGAGIDPEIASPIKKADFFKRDQLKANTVPKAKTANMDKILRFRAFRACGLKATLMFL
jgi:hypothetical protein